MERNEWIVNYLKGKEVKKVDLEDFFTIENEEKPINIKQVGDYTYTYTTNLYAYTVTINPLKPYITTYTVADVVVTVL